MGTIYKNSGLRMAMQSALGATKTISAATNAAPGVFTSTAHGFVNGDFILLEVNGMVEVNKRVFQVRNVAANTFELEDPTGAASIDTTSFGVFVSGTAKAVTFGTTITGVQEFSPSGGDVKFLDTTTVQDTNDKQVANGTTAISFGLTMQWDPTDAAQIAMINASKLGQERAFRIMWPNNTYCVFYGTVGYAGVPGGGNQGITTSPAAIGMSGDPTFGV